MEVVVQKIWFSPDELFQEHGITKPTQAKMRSEKRIPYHKVGRFIKYKISDINNWIDQAKVV